MNVKLLRNLGGGGGRVLTISRETTNVGMTQQGPTDRQHVMFSTYTRKMGVSYQWLPPPVYPCLDV